MLSIVDAPEMHTGVIGASFPTGYTNVTECYGMTAAEFKNAAAV